MEKKEQLYEGKAKKVFATDDANLVIVDYKDDATAFNGEKKGTITGKGVINNVMSNHMFQLLEQQGVPTHFVEQLSERETLVKKVSIVPLEVIIRNISAGSFAKRFGVEEGIVFDEPTNGLDPNQIVEIRHLIKEIAEERTVILSTHILSEVQATCDYIRMIEEGQVVFAGTVEEFDNYIVPNTIFVSLASAPPVDELKMLSGVEDAVSMGGMDYRVNFSDSREAITQIVEASVTRNWQLLEIRMEKSSMDSVFAELSAKSKNR